jgi:NAD(P)-dependent dehydrogenase (short-subunit alcohol dehydrogenase family)
MSIILITGATDGIGLESAQQLAQQGHELVLHGRTEAKATSARNAVLQRSSTAKIHTAYADLANLADVVRMANNINTQLPRLDVLLNNAGVYMTVRKLSRDGFEMTMAVNHLAHFLLTALLLPLLKKSAEPRVITVSSMVHSSGRIELDNLNSERRFDGYHAYCNSKLANALFAVELAPREPWLSSNFLHPGVVDTKLLHAAFDMTGNSVHSGAKMPVYLATSPDVKGISGKYFDNCKITPPLTAVNDTQLAQQLWQWSEQAIGNVL